MNTKLFSQPQIPVSAWLTELGLKLSWRLRLLAASLRISRWLDSTFFDRIFSLSAVLKCMQRATNRMMIVAAMETEPILRL